MPWWIEEKAASIGKAILGATCVASLDKRVP